jgi:glycerate kinase
MAPRGIPSTVLVAPDSFKGTFSAPEVTEAIAAGLRAAGREVDLCPVGDGGEGTAEALAGALELAPREATVSDPLGRPLRARFFLGAGGLAVLDLATASGLSLVSGAERDPLAASTRGTGELIAAARGAGARRIIVGAGGSATTDGGRGAIEAVSRAGGLGDAALVVLCDVRTTFECAAAVFAPQKGADSGQVRVLARRLDAFAERLPRDPRGISMGGAAGGFAGGAWAALGAELDGGAAFVLDAVGFDARMLAARAVVTGEGRLDSQSLSGKVVSEVATRARQSGVPCHAIVGENRLDRFGHRILDLQTVREAGTRANLRRAGETLAAEL